MIRKFQNASMIVMLFILVCQAGAGPGEKDFLVGGDISALTVIEEKGGKFLRDGKACDPLVLFKESGWNCFRLRIFVNPNKEGIVTQDLPYTLALAKRIKAHGLKLLLDFHYSDTWADPSHQWKPKAWEELNFSQLQQQVTDYTAEVIGAMAQEGVLPDIVQVGNEINPGMIWPDGQLGGSDVDKDKQWFKLACLLKAGIKGVQAPLKDGRQIRIMIHIASGGNWSHTQYFVNQLNKHNVPFDIIGQSYYPWWHGTLADLQENLEKTAQTFGKDIMVVETAYPHRDNFSRSKATWTSDRLAWPASPQGQADFLKALVSTVRQTPDHHGCGVNYWYPESIPVKGMGGWFGGAMAVFDKDGNALPAIQALGDRPGTAEAAQ